MKNKVSEKNILIQGAEYKQLYLSDWEKLIEKSGDIDAYENLITYYFVEGNTCSKALRYSEIMAEKYCYPEAYYELAVCIIKELYPDNRDFDFDKLKPDIKLKLIDYLTLASKGEVLAATNLLEEIMPITQDSSTRSR